MNDNDHRLLARLRAGDRRAFETFYNAHAQRLLRTALAYTAHNRATAEDVVHDVFVRLWEQRDTIRVRTTITAYLFTAVRNRALDLTKHARIVERHVNTLPVEQSAEPSTDDSATPEERVTALLASLSPQRREVVRLRWIEGLSYAEIAEITGGSIPAVEKTLQRALAQMRLIQNRDKA